MLSTQPKRTPPACSAGGGIPLDDLSDKIVQRMVALHCVYRLGGNGEIVSIEAWSRNSVIASEAFKELIKQYPDDRFAQRRRSHVDAAVSA